MAQAMNSPNNILDLTKLAKNKRSSRSSRTPMSVFEQIPPAKLPISPPPEETLRRVSKPTPFTPSLLVNAGAVPVSAPKRKRTAVASSGQPPASPGPAEATPNPKPRKQTKHHIRQNSIPSPTRSSSTAPQELTPTKTKRVVLKSPHVANPDADYLPPMACEAEGSTARRTFSAKARRSATPIPPYEPPSVVYTPPREVMMTPTISKSSKRKTKRHTNSKHLKINLPIKKELPDIDLNAPMPPASPTDDPLLLSGSVVPLSTPPKAKVFREVAIEAQTLPPSSSPIDEQFDDLPMVQPTWEAPYSDSSDLSYMDMDDNAQLAAFDLNIPVSDGAWTDSDDEDADPEVIEGVGEITGRWRMMKVPTKQDPPSSATRDRMEKWGRPISPFPRKSGGNALQTLEDDIEPDELGSPIQKLDFSRVRDNTPQPSAATPLPSDAQLQRAAIELDTADLDQDSEIEELTQQDIMPARAQAEHVHQDPNVSGDSNMSFPEPDAMESHSGDEAEEEEVRLLSVEPESHEERVQSPGDDQHDATPVELTHDDPVNQPLAMQQDDVHAEASESSHSPSAYSILFPRREPLVPQVNDAVDTSIDDEDGTEEEYDTGLGVVKISSSDPKAAARAAAILKQHDYDCFTKILQQKKRRTSHSTVDSVAHDNRRRSLVGSGIRKTQSAKKERRLTLGGVVGDQVFIPGTPVMTLPQLLAEAEKDLSVHHEQESLCLSPRRDPFKTPLPRRHSAVVEHHQPAPSQFTVSDVGQRVWAKDDWKQLDGCFTDERLAAGMDQGLQPDELADVDDVQIENVVERFVTLYGGYDVINQFGDAWKRDNILQRASALRNKQEAGHVAPPTTPRVTSSASNSPRLPTMAVPDFTPLARRPPSKSRPVLPPPVVDGPFKDLAKVPPTLLAPRYSHLFEEAVAVSENQHLTTPKNRNVDVHDQSGSIDDEYSLELSASLPPPSHSTRPEPPSTTLGKRVKGFLFSYLPSMPKTAPPATKIKSSTHPGLPLPPLDILSKSRPPVVTPARPPIPKSKAPKELVQLHHGPQPTIAPSRIPRLVQPRRLVELHPVPKPVELVDLIKPIPRPRRSSGSVKDLIQNYEQLDSSTGRSTSRLSQYSQQSEVGSSVAGSGAPNRIPRPWRP
ncbi:hypothetical protein BDN72DRAFT_90243 [Pluteus cervinus]|uniref:Uncharacterized protein n=1 Tax=Pluteus cervinus TaxID=181527 RepID=A0ACD3AP49_9AGAR|nr:hypothetical protein BDN72DRAFT_90243 [Pluteus cervinus]